MASETEMSTNSCRNMVSNTLYKYMLIGMKSPHLLVSVYLTYAHVFGSTTGALSVCCSLADVDVIIVISAVADDQVTAVSLHEFTQVKVEA